MTDAQEQAADRAVASGGNATTALAVPTGAGRPQRRRLGKRTKLIILNAISIVGGIGIWWVLALSGFQLPTPPEVVERAAQLWSAGPRTRKSWRGRIATAAKSSLLRLAVVPAQRHLARCSVLIQRKRLCFRYSRGQS